jgi:hypothetical protein
MEPNNNLVIWNQVSKTDTAHTKPVSLGGRKMTSIDGTSVVMQATKVFGPVGIGWGYNIIEERFDQGMPIIKGGEVICNVLVHTIRLKLWYMLEGTKGEVEHFGHTPFVYSSYEKGAVQDMEVSKKSLTDAIKKCLSMLGFNADIFLGKFDDRDYVDTLKIEEDIKKSDDQGKATAVHRDKLRAEIEVMAKGYSLIPHLSTLNTVHGSNSRTLEKKCRMLNLPYSQAIVEVQKAYKAQADKIAPDVKLFCTDCGTESIGKVGSSCHQCSSTNKLISQEGN